MEDRVKNVVKKSLDEIEKLQSKLLDAVDDVPEDAKEIRDTMDKSFNRIVDRLKDSLDKGETLSEEAQLQAHLGLMEAQEKLQSSTKIVDGYMSQVVNSSKTTIDELEVKAQLAKMEVEDFWEERGPELTKEFNKSKAQMHELAEKAADELQNQFIKWNSLFSKKDG